jgi:hypothetical protein
MMKSKGSRPGLILFIPARDSIRVLLTHKEGRPVKFKGKVVYDPLSPRGGWGGALADGPPWQDEWAFSNVIEYEVVPERDASNRGHRDPAVRLEFRPGFQSPGPGLTQMTVPGSDTPVYISDEGVLSNADVESARVVEGPHGPQIEIVFTKAGAQRFASATESNLMEPLAIFVDGQLLSAPIVREKISGGKAIITGRFSKEEAERIANGIAAEQTAEQDGGRILPLDAADKAKQSTETRQPASPQRHLMQAVQQAEADSTGKSFDAVRSRVLKVHGGETPDVLRKADLKVTKEPPPALTIRCVPAVRTRFTPGDTVIDSLGNESSDDRLESQLIISDRQRVYVFNWLPAPCKFVAKHQYTFILGSGAQSVESIRDSKDQIIWKQDEKQSRARVPLIRIEELDNVERRK